MSRPLRHTHARTPTRTHTITVVVRRPLVKGEEDTDTLLGLAKLSIAGLQVACILYDRQGLWEPLQVRLNPNEGDDLTVPSRARTLANLLP